ncbi:caspase family protein [Aurantiacibacter sp. MUD11]|uniref:pre-peptidase C-terminal domain-containing protein n=1 Tax=Aurantiacibacter sp. MUD11 TaxID=3003265 RepID=UPI0022AA2940|nr:pre-peptidase C-terminal domain-containing protein [Aurantiacibacter sp. MUD11]WAT17560.1 caspase family protein [Aurantiacibacter sp. MUD11]
MMKRILLGGVGGIALAAAATGFAFPTEAPVDTASEAAAKPVDKQYRKPARVSGGRITLGETATSTLQGGTHTYTLEAEAGQRLRMVLSSDDFDTVLRIDGPGGFSVENDDEPSGLTLNSLIDTRLPASGTYRITVDSYQGSGSGAYRLATLDPANPVPAGVEAGTIALGQATRGRLVQSDATTLTGENVDYYRFAGRQGQRLTIDIESEQIDPYLTLYLPDGRMEENDDRGGIEDTNSRLSITLPLNGTYTLAASSFSPGESGDYTVRMAEADPATRTVRPASGSAQVYALSVGVANYERINPLNRTDEDAERVTHALRQAGVLAPESVTLTDAQATRANFRRALRELTQAMGPDDTLLIFFSGHGEKVENMTTERDGSAETIELFDAALYDYELAEMMQGVDARTLLVIDACFAGGFDQVIDQRDERMGIFSSDADTLSLVASGEKSGGYISHIFRQALEGAADMNGDGAMEAGELSEYMRREFYTMVLAEPLGTDAEDFRDHQVPGFQHIIVDRGGDGMPFQQVLWNAGSASQPRMARAD